MRILSHSLPTVAAALFTAAALTTSADAAFTVILPGNSDFTGWNNLNNINNPGYPNGGNHTGAWPAPITANIAGSDAGGSLNKLSGGGYPASTATNALYNLFTAGSYAVTDSSPLADLATVVFQFDLAGGTTDPPFEPGIPTLSYNGGTQALPASFTASQPGTFTGDFGGASFSTTTHAFQWDLSGIAVPITDYTINWTTSAHTLTYQVTANGGDTFAQVVPEPSGIVLLSLGGITFLTGRKRKMGH